MVVVVGQVVGGVSWVVGDGCMDAGVRQVVAAAAAAGQGDGS